MITDSYFEIPRMFTATAEALACIIYILPLKKRHKGHEHHYYMIAGPVALVLTHLVSDELPLMFWIPAMMAAMTVMFLYIRSVCDLSAYDAGFLFVRAFILAEFAAAIEWQIYYYVLYKGVSHNWWLASFIMISVYSVIFIFAYWIDARKVFADRRLGVSLKELINALIIGVATFSVNNINFIIDSPFVVRQSGANVLYIRTLVDFCGLLILYAWNEQRREMYLDHELRTINDILYKQYEQYQTSKESMDLINRKYHDLKHQIAMIRKEQDPAKKDEYLREIDHAMGVYESQYDTGNKVIDTILTGKSLYCKEHDINLSCVVNGELLCFMGVMDICSVFGNALDNSIESVEKIADKEKRIIRVAVFSRNNFLMMRFENYFEEKLEFRDGMPVTTKGKTDYHGYGIKSIKKTIEQYDGNMTISIENSWFVVKILLPIPTEGDGNTGDLK